MNTYRPPVPAHKAGAFGMSFRPFLDRAKLRGAAAVEQMAEDFRIFAANAGSISKDDLEILGWSSTQISLHAADARAAANRAAAG